MKDQRFLTKFVSSDTSNMLGFLAVSVPPMDVDIVTLLITTQEP